MPHRFASRNDGGNIEYRTRNNEVKPLPKNTKKTPLRVQGVNILKEYTTILHCGLVKTAAEEKD